MVGALVIIDHNRKFIFVHVPKTGGQSITHALGGKTKEITTHGPLHIHDKPGYFRFGFVRNPWDRMVSLYHFLCQKTFRNSDNFCQPEVRAAGFKKWLTHHDFYMKEDFQLPMGESWVVGGRGGLPPMQQRTQMWWLGDCDFTGQFENIQNDLVVICKHIGIKAKPLKCVNSTKHNHYREYYDDETREFIAKHFKPEIDRFGYQF